MDKIEALRILDTVCAQITMSREGHAKVIAALNVLKKELGIPDMPDVASPSKELKDVSQLPVA